MVGCSKTAEGYIRVLHTSKMVLCKRGADPDLATRVNVKGVLAKTSFPSYLFFKGACFREKLAIFLFSDEEQSLVRVHLQ